MRTPITNQAPSATAIAKAIANAVEIAVNEALKDIAAAEEKRVANTAPDRRPLYQQPSGDDAGGKFRAPKAED